MKPLDSLAVSSCEMSGQKRDNIYHILRLTYSIETIIV